MPTTYVSPYTVTVTSTAGGLAQCSYVDGNNQQVPAGTVLTTSTPAGEPGELVFNFTEATLQRQNLRLVAAVVKTVGNDPTMGAHNYLTASRTESGGQWLDSVIVPWSIDTYTVRGVVLVFAQVDNEGAMMNFFPSADPQTENDKQ